MGDSLDAKATVLRLVDGLVLILSGLYMLNAYFFFVPGLAA
jgi:hypothetical protein